jgi:SSS family solute:Na+ symporter
MVMSPLVGPLGWGIFLGFFVIFVFLGFYGARWRRGDLSQLHEWALAGRRLGTFLVWFLVGADLYTAYTFIAVLTRTMSRFTAKAITTM